MSYDNPTVKLPPNAVDSLWYNNFLIYTVQDPYQYVTPPKEPTYTAHAWRPQDNRQFRVGGPTENRFYPHRSRVVLLWAVRQALEAPPLPILTIPLPDYDGFKLTVARVPNITEQLFVGKAERGSLVVEDQHAESDKLVINLRLKIDRYTYLEKEAKDLSNTEKLRKGDSSFDEGKAMSQKIADLLNDVQEPLNLNKVVRECAETTLGRDIQKLKEVNEDVKKLFTERSKAREKKSQLRDEKGRYSKYNKYEFKYDPNSVIGDEGSTLIEMKLIEDDAVERGNS